MSLPSPGLPETFPRKVTDMITLSASARFGYGGKQYIAHITGRSSKFTFDREFIGRKYGKRNEGSEADVDEAGLYETCDIDKRGDKESTYYVILGEDDNLARYEISKDLAMKIAKRLDGPEQIADILTVDDEDIILLTPAQAKRRQATATLESAVEARWDMLQCLPEKEAKKVLTALRKRVSPPKPKSTEGGEQND